MRNEAVTLGGLSAIAVLLIAAFAIDRLVNATLFLLSFWPPWDDRFNPLKHGEGVERDKVERTRKLLYFSMAGACSVVVIVALGSKGILYHIGFADHWLDWFLTALILMGGAERLGELLKVPGAPAGGSEAPVKIEGTLQLIEPSKAARGAAGD